MRKIVFRFWLVNVLLSVVLFVLYRFFIAGLEPADTTFWARFFNFLDILLNLGFSMIYLFVMVAGSFAVFLNLMERVKRSYFLSFLTFAAVPLVCVVFLGVNVWMDVYRYGLTPAPLKTLLCLFLIYLACAVIEFLVFRKKVNNTYR
uniref:hypothetical protein n=1 Tax=Pedobacter schmidteae TaxID=2201271 RepID=UPI000EB49CA5|nr:hypothetical protein [Pedobacter schmidteae]